MKRILILTMVSLLMLNTVGFAAVGGSKMKMSAPKISNTKKANTNTSSDYKASAPANSYKEKAPEANAKSNANMGQQKSTSGGFMRNLGMIAGGMMLGGMLSQMFGLGGSGFFDLFFGVLANVILFGGLIMLGSFIWRKIKENKMKSNNYK